MNKLEFTKMQSLGNDFVIVDATRTEFNLDARHIETMGHRHLGVGFDQLLVLDSPQNSEVDFNYRIFNADGGEVEQCGNGVRCLALFIQKNHFPHRNFFKLMTQNRQISTSIEGRQVRVQMGVPLFEPARIPFIASEPLPAYDLAIDDKIYSLGVLSMGNPHAVLQVASIKEAPVDLIGPLISTHNRFPDQINVEFMKVIDPSRILLRVYERGVGETLACGSGACAAVVMGIKWGLLDKTVSVNLPGGDLTVNWISPNDPVELIGSGEFVFTGHFLFYT